MIHFKIINPASATIVMAFGIFLYATIEAFPFIDQMLGEILTIALIIMGVLVYFSLTLQFFQRKFLFSFFNNPVNSFVMGAWIAGVSILCNVITKYFPKMNEIAQFIGCVNTILWFPFLIYCLYNFKQLYKRPTRHSIHGVILLSTVATQSLVVVWTELFSLTGTLVISVIIVGLLFYLCGILLIVVHYRSEKQWSLTVDWSNTNCIIHGALSITGLALVSSQLMSSLALIFFWFFVLILLIVVETIEISRAIFRIQRFGWREGIFTYNISQWSRNFTLGMFYAFTMMVHENPYDRNAMYNFHEIFLKFWGWIVLIVLVGEIILWMESKSSFFKRINRELPFDYLNRK